MKTNFLIIGGDKRQQYLKRKFEADFYDVIHIRYSGDLETLDDIESYTHIILPIPISKDNLTVYNSDSLKLTIRELKEKLGSCHRVYGGGFTDNFLINLEDKHITYFDFMKDKNFKLANAYLTAQGAMRLLLENTDDVVSGKKSLIIGFGDVAKTLAEKLKAFGIDVYIAARNKKQLSVARLNGYKTMGIEKISDLIYMFDFVFGTVPANILTADDVKSSGVDCVYFELSSAPYTAEKDDFERFGKRYILASALPGKYLPEASADIIYDFILNNL